jgi:hypothetical protein
MLIELCGRPFTVESRFPPGVRTPGRNVMKSSVLRVASGRLAICFVFSVVDTAEDCVCTICVAPSTTTCSVRPPTSSLTCTVAGAPEVTATPLSTAVLNPDSSTVTV